MTPRIASLAASVTRNFYHFLGLNLNRFTSHGMPADAGFAIE